MTPEERKEFDQLKHEVQTNWHRQCETRSEVVSLQDSRASLWCCMGFVVAVALIEAGALISIWRAM